MAGSIVPNNRKAWDPENESWDEFKARRHEGQSGTGQRNSQVNARELARKQVSRKEYAGVELA